MDEDALNLDERLKVLRLLRIRSYQVLCQGGRLSRSRPWHIAGARRAPHAGGGLNPVATARQNASRSP